MPINKSLMVLNIEEQFKHMFPEFSLDFPGACLFWAAATNHIFRLHNIRSKIAAGSMNWPIVPKHLDDGVRPTHFSYEFEPDGRSMILSSYLGCLPEMHVWVQLTDTHEIVDLSLRSLRENYMQLTGNNPQWLAPSPPKYIWTDAPPAGTYYRKDIQATRIALQALRSLQVSPPSNSPEL